MTWQPRAGDQPWPMNSGSDFYAIAEREAIQQEDEPCDT